MSNNSFQDPDPDPDPVSVPLLSHNIDLRIWIQIPIHMIIMGLIILVTFIMRKFSRKCCWLLKNEWSPRLQIFIQIEGAGDRLLFQNGPTPDSLLAVPLTQVGYFIVLSTSNFFYWEIKKLILKEVVKSLKSKCLTWKTNHTMWTLNIKIWVIHHLKYVYHALHATRALHGIYKIHAHHVLHVHQAIHALHIIPATQAHYAHNAPMTLQSLHATNTLKAPQALHALHKL